nr:AIM24 family protein [Nocardia farcinica]
MFGAIDVIDLQPGEPITIDTGHVVAYDLAMNFTIRRAVSGRSIQSLKSGEGFVFDFVGPGRVLLQTRNPGAFGAWAASMASSS